MFNVNDLLEDHSTKVWDNLPGGKIVKRWQENKVKYVAVQFERTPGVLYKYLQG